MANIGVRSPYFIYYTETADGGTGIQASYATLSLTIGGALRYTITKNTGTEFLIDIAELVRDFVNPRYIGIINREAAQAVPVSYLLQFYAADGTTRGLAKAKSHTAFDAYNYFSEGNTYVPEESGFAMPAFTVMLSGPVLWYPENTAGSFFYINSTGAFTRQDFSATATSTELFTGTFYEQTIYIRRLPCSKYETKKLVFFNKFGVAQELFFTAKSTESIAVTGDKFKSGFVSENGTVDRFQHQIVDYNKNGKIKYTLNTTFICEGVTRYIQELLLSERVWLVTEDNYYPVNVTSSSVQYKNSVNDKLVNYTIEVEQANDLISTVR
jgi:hypothetical protein